MVKVEQLRVAIATRAREAFIPEDFTLVGTPQERYEDFSTIMVSAR